MTRSSKSRRRFGFGGKAAAAAVGIVTLLALPGVAHAAPGLDSGRWVVPVGVQPDTVDYSTTTTHAYWSVVMLSPQYRSTPSVVDYNLAVSDSSGNVLAESTLGDFGKDYVAIDSNHRTQQTYGIQVNKVASNGTEDQYGLMFVDGNTILNRGETIVPARNGGGPGDRWPRAQTFVFDVLLFAGQTATFLVGEHNEKCNIVGCIGTLYLDA